MTENCSPIYLEGISSASAMIKAVRTGCARRKILRVLADASKQKSEFRRIAFLKAAAEELGFPFELVPKEKIESLAQGRTHGGILCEVSDAVFPDAEALVPAKSGFSVLLEGAEDPYSLGHSIRSLYSCGATALILPRRYPTGADATLARASAGCSELLPIYICDPSEAADRYLSAGYTVAAAEIKDSLESCDAPLDFPVLLLVGGEKRGISASLLSKASQNLRIPYERDFMGSLPTETAVAMLAYELMLRNRKNNRTK